MIDGTISSTREVPQPSVCEFCGTLLYHDAFVKSGADNVFAFAPFPRHCNCEKAQAYRQQRKAEADRKRAEEEAAEEMERRRRRIEKRIGDSGIKKRFQKRTFENFVCDTSERLKCYNTAKTYADRFSEFAKSGEGLYIEGSNGTGKTHLAAAIALQLIRENVPVVCKTSSGMLSDIKRSFDSGEIPEHEVLDAYKTVDLLIIDDLGKEQCTDWSMSTLYSIMNDRYEDMKPTIITTNYNADDLMKALTPRGYDDTKIRAIISRLREVSTVMTMAWADYRGRQEEL